MTLSKKTKEFSYAVGIDCGVNTGFAVWSVSKNDFVIIECLPIHQALEEVRINFLDGVKIKVFIEDARLRRWFGKNATAKLQGAGSIKRDCKIWEDFCTDYGIDFMLVNPKNNITKLDKVAFTNITKWKGKSNEHSRDAAMMVFGRNY